MEAFEYYLNRSSCSRLKILKISLVINFITLKVEITITQIAISISWAWMFSLFYFNFLNYVLKFIFSTCPQILFQPTFYISLLIPSTAKIIFYNIIFSLFLIIIDITVFILLNSLSLWTARKIIWKSIKRNLNEKFIFRRFWRKSFFLVIEKNFSMLIKMSCDTKFYNLMITKDCKVRWNTFI